MNNNQENKITIISLISEIPTECVSKVFLFLAHPLADIMRDACECRRRLDEKWGNTHAFCELFWHWTQVAKHVASYYPLQHLFRDMLDERWFGLQTHSRILTQEEEEEEEEEEDEDEDATIREFDEDGLEVFDGQGGWVPILYDFTEENMQHFVSALLEAPNILNPEAVSGIVYLRHTVGYAEGWHEWHRDFNGPNFYNPPIIYTEMIPGRTVSFHVDSFAATHYRKCWSRDQSRADTELSREVSRIIFITGDGNTSESDEDAEATDSDTDSVDIAPGVIDYR